MAARIRTLRPTAHPRTPLPEQVTEVRFNALMSDFARTFSSLENAHGTIYKSYDAKAADLVRRHPAADPGLVRTLVATTASVWAALLARHREAE